ncbi:MAG: membrane protein insertase YidC [Alphaproteobacteria bacterium]|nr:membrane protein insertase YidC [Alphaproteobacteria bacterium]
MFKDNKRNLIIAIAISVVIMIGFQFLMPQPEPPPPAPVQSTAQAPTEPGSPTAGTTGATAPTTESQAAPTIIEREKALANSPRVRIEAPRIHGSIALTGARFDDLTFKEYRETIEPDSKEVVLLSPTSTTDPYFAEFGWVPTEAGVAVADSKTVWTADREVLTPDAPVTLRWDNGAGLRFSRIVTVDQDYLFTVTQKVENTGTTPVTLQPYGQIERLGVPPLVNYYILHEGPVGVLNDTLIEQSYGNLLGTPGCVLRQEAIGGWLGITDKYWLTALLPDQSRKVVTEFGARPGAQAGTCEPKFKTNFLHDPVTIAPGASAESTDRLFAGAKVVNLLNRYGEELGVNRFEDAVDFGWLWFLTKPMFFLIDFFFRNVGNFGVAILLLTVCVRILLFPLANKAYVSMSKMRKLQPDMIRLKERHKDDKVRFQQEMMALYRREKANPVAGCFPILVQIPVFFALYKVLFVSLEMRHAPFFWWIQDLSAPDPMAIITGFGAFDWGAPSFLMIGVWPIIYAFTLWLQQKLNPQPLDPLQAKILLALPIIFLFMFAQFPAGLVIYWTWNNILSIAQQYVIMRRMGVTKAALTKEHAELQALKAELAGGGAAAAAAMAGGSGGSKSGEAKSVSAKAEKPAKPATAAPVRPSMSSLFKRDKGKSSKGSKSKAKPWPKDEPEVESRQVRRARERAKPTRRS